MSGAVDLPLVVDLLGDLDLRGDAPKATPRQPVTAAA